MPDTKPGSTASVPVVRGGNPIRNLQSGVNRLFDDFFGDFTFPVFGQITGGVFALSPAIDITETGEGYSISAEVPGLDIGDIDVSAADNCLTLSGEKSFESESQDRNYVRQERSYGNFRRVITMPADADLDSTSATIRNGVLTIAIKRRKDAASQSRKIDIREVA